ncbi:endonuclease/exonuclease/phosphatase family protein [Streptomyces sp. NPDC003660]
MTEDLVRLVLVNFEHDGGPEPKAGELPPLWQQLYGDVLRPLLPHWLALTELTYSQTRPEASPEEKEAAERRWRTGRKILGMEGFRARMGQGRNPVGLLVRPETFKIGNSRDYPHVHRTPPASAVITLPEVPQVPIVSAAFHSSFCSPVGRLAEVQELTALVDKVKAHRGQHADFGWSGCWLAGDTNSYPVPVGERVPEIDWASPKITDIVHRRHRALKLPDRSWKSCTEVDEALLDVGMHDAARYAAHRLDQPTALSATAGFERPEQGGPCRIDRVYLDAWTVQAVTAVTVINLSGLSDHDAVVVDLSRRKLADALRRNHDQLKPWALVTDCADVEQLMAIPVRSTRRTAAGTFRRSATRSGRSASSRDASASLTRSCQPLHGFPIPPRWTPS